MRNFLLLLLTGILLTACGQGTARGQKSQPSTPAVQEYTYRILNTYPHSRKAYTQGLQYIDGQLWEGTGQNGESRLQTVDLETGKESIVRQLPHNEFGEGITILGEKIYQLTWQDNKCYVYDLKTGKTLNTFRYHGEGWGLTTDGENLWMSNGTEQIWRINPTSFKREGKITVTHKGHTVKYLNELEWIDGRLWANVYLEDQILIIDPKTGKTEGVIHLEGLLPSKDYTPTTDVLNGIAYDKDKKRIFVTGKNWPKLFQIEIVKQ